MQDNNSHLQEVVSDKDIAHKKKQANNKDKMKKLKSLNDDHITWKADEHDFTIHIENLRSGYKNTA